ncbi:VCBS repeat-containing protein [Streptomyces sp. NPDC006551]|uniref:FG-GAP repeat domain-containing protein n=1 Tax=Streptomyces sp. NPDC006551 TaxID=3157178 RepID=UPI0033B9C3AC
MTTYLRRAGIALASLVAVVATQAVLAAPQAVAADWPVPSGSTVAKPLTPVSNSKAKLEYTDLTDVANKLQAANPTALRDHSIGTVVSAADLDGVGLDGRRSCFTDPGDEVLATSTGFCWNAEDTSTTVWMPQGVATNTEASLPVDGRQIVIGSWYKTEEGQKNQASRLTIANASDTTRVRYIRVMLVEPDGTSFRRLATHADAVVWYKNWLFVGNGEGYWVFDANRFWKVDPSRTHMGKGADGIFGAEGYSYALPLVGKYYDPEQITIPHAMDPAQDQKFECGTWHREDPTDSPCHGGASLDLSNGAHLVSAEVTARKTTGVVEGFGGTIARWPFDSSTGLLRHSGLSASGKPVARPTEVLFSPILGAQGIVSRDNTYLIPAPCPEYVPGGAAMNSCIYRALPKQPVQLWKRVSKHIENLAYETVDGKVQLWISNESTSRVMERVEWPQLGGPLRLITDAGGDTKTDGIRDMFAVDHRGLLWRYDGTGSGGYHTPELLGGGWGGMTKLVGAGDLTGDRRPDLLAVDGEGKLWRYNGDGNGRHSAPLYVGGGWNGIRLLTNAGDVTSDGFPDLYAVDTTGTLYLYPGTGTGAHKARVAVATGWNVYSRITGAGNLNSDDKPDLLAVHGTTGHLYRFDGDGVGGHSLPTDLKGGWEAFDTLIGAGKLNADATDDLVVRESSTGEFKLYAGTGNGTFATPQAWHF